MVRVPFNPTIRLACKKCHRQTDHVLVAFSNSPTSAMTLSYECQECCTIKQIFELNTFPESKTTQANGNESKQPQNDVNQTVLIPIEAQLNH